MAEPISLQTLLTYLGLISIPVGVSYHIMTLRNQNRARQIQIMKGANILGDHIWKLFAAEFTDFEDWWEKYGFDSNPEFRKLYLDHFNQLEELGVYVKEGLLDVRYLVMLGGHSIIYMWEMYQPINEGLKAKFGPNWFTEAEYLYERVKDYMERHPELET